MQKDLLHQESTAPQNLLQELSKAINPQISPLVNREDLIKDMMRFIRNTHCTDLQPLFEPIHTNEAIALSLSLTPVFNAARDNETLRNELTDITHDVTAMTQCLEQLPSHPSIATFHRLYENRRQEQIRFLQLYRYEVAEDVVDALTPDQTEAIRDLAYRIYWR